MGLVILALLVVYMQAIHDDTSRLTVMYPQTVDARHFSEETRPQVVTRFGVGIGAR